MEVLIITVGLIVIFVLLSTLLGRRGEWSSAFQAVAQRYGGWYSPAGVFRRPAATFTYKEAQCHVRCRIRRGRPVGAETEFSIQWPSRRMRLVVVRNFKSLRRHRWLRRGQTHATGDPNFDEQFETICTKAATADKLLSSGVCWQIQQLAAFQGDDAVFVSINRGWLTVVKPGYTKRLDALDDLVRLCLELYDQLMLTRSEGIEFTQDNVVAAVEMIQCPVCSNDVEGQMVICVRCKTPHCLDCWQYNGACGMFACGETRYMAISSATPSNAEPDH